MKQIIVLLLSTAMGVIMMSCKESATNPPEEKPPGYQEDIPWPSLADSPWPMYRADPQNTGRFNGNLIVVENTFSVVDSIVVGGGAVLYDKDINSSVSAAEQPGFTTFSKNAQIKWRQSIFPAYRGAFFGTPLIDKNKKIYFPALTTSRIYKINLNGAVEDSVLIEGLQGVPLGIDKNMNIYTLGSGKTLYRINFNNQKVEPIITNNNFRGIGFSFSINGDRILIGGVNSGIFNIDMTKKEILWSFGNQSTFALPVVDCDDNIYVITASGADTLGKHGLYSLRADGSIRWFYPFGNSGSFYHTPTIDRLGNLYFGGDSIHCLKNSGELKWRKYLDGEIVSSDLTSDNNGQCVFTTINPVDGKNYLNIFSSTGTRLLKIFIYVGVEGYFSPSLSSNYIVVSPLNNKIFILN